MDSDPVTIIVKAPNQQFEDQTIQCELSWTIKRLKGLLSEVYPSKPKTDEQKLIYSGQLLSDAIVLKDILRQYEGQDTHTVHLVLQPKNRVFETATPSKVNQIPTQQTVNTDGLRQRARPSNITDDGIFRPQANWANVLPSQNQDQNNAWVAQQMVSYNMMMEQIYRQYYTQYMNNVGQSNSSFLSQSPGPSNLPQMPYYPQQNYFTSPFTFNSPLSQQQQPPQQQDNPVPAQQPPVADQQPQVAPPQAQVPQQPLPEQQPNPAQQRFPNIVQEEVENRDWLDMFYAFSRLMVLVTLVYFYSSPLRCLIVIFFTILYYGYHVGYFRQFNREQNNNQQPNGQLNNNENIAQQPPAAEQQQRPVDADDNEENPNPNDADPLVNPVATTDNDGANNENNRTPVFVLVRTFIMSFFASLIPETPAL